MKPEFFPLHELPQDFSELLLSWRNSSAVRSQMLHQGVIPQESHQRWYKNMVEGKTSAQMRVAFLEGRPFGVVSLSEIDPELSCALWGLYIGEPTFRGRGLGKALLAHLLFWGFEELGLYRLYASVLADNKAAQSLYVQAGFQEEGVWREHVSTDKGRQNLHWVGMTAPEWQSHRKKTEKWITG